MVAHGRLRQWQTGIKIDPRSLQTLPVWVTFLDLDLQFWSTDMLRKIGNKVGRPHYIDKMKAQNRKHGRVSYARMLVEVDAQATLREKIILHDPDKIEYPRKILYDWRSWWCKLCAKFGHRKGDFPTHKQIRKMWVHKELLVTVEEEEVEIRKDEEMVVYQTEDPFHKESGNSVLYPL